MGILNIEEILKEMTLEEKASMCSGADFWHTEAIDRLSLPAAMLSDGPHGLRKQEDDPDHLGIAGSIEAVCFPTASAMACSFDRELIQQTGAALGEECQAEGVNVLLGPGINMKRSPLCGRNFEYFSEDPLLTGKIAAAIVRGIASKGVHATIKHFACNSQESGRHIVNAIVSQRALREIYVKAFEIAVKEGNAQSIMTSYNPVNGYWTASAYDLNTTLLRNEWGFAGIVMTDWGAKINDVIEGGEGSNQRTADMIRSQNDIYMVVNNNGAEINSYNDNTLEALETGRLTLGELQRSAMNICCFLMKTPALNNEGNGVVNILSIQPLDTNPQAENALDDHSRIVWNTAVETSKYFMIQETANYDIIVRLMSPQTFMAQTVCKTILNGKELVTFQTNGTEGKWNLQKLLRVNLKAGCYQITLQFPKPGMEVDYMEFRQCDTMN